MRNSCFTDVSNWKILFCCIICSLLTGIITTYVNKRPSTPPTANKPQTRSEQTATTTTIPKASILSPPHQFVPPSNNTYNHNINTNASIPPAPNNIPSITVSPQTHIAKRNKNGLLSHPKNSHSEHFHLINQVVTAYPDQIARKITIDNKQNMSPSSPKNKSKNTNQVKNDNFIDNHSDERERIVIVSFKLPIIVTKLDNNEWRIQFKNEMSFLSNLRILQNNDSQFEVVFVGWPGIFCENKEEEESLEDALYDLNKYRCYPIYLNQTQVSLAYDTFCNSILWPSFHYQMCINDGGEFGILYESSWKSYCDLNCKYAKKASVATENEDLSYIWFHDYHLLMAAQFVKKDKYTLKCALFLHTVFPTSEVFRCLPSRKELLRGMLCNDLLGFHTYDYTRHFLSSCKRILNLDFHTLPIESGGALAVHYLGRDVAIRVSHIGIRSIPINYKLILNKMMKNSQQYRYLVQVLKEKQERKLIVSMGSNDIIHGTLYNLKAYSKFLSIHEAWRSEVCFIQILQSSSYHKSRLKLSNNNRHRIEESIRLEIESIKNTYNADCILLIDKHYTYNELMTLFRLCDVGLFGTFWEGFNCGPFQYTASQSNKDCNPDLPGALIISEFMGCRCTLSGVFRINPFDYEQVADTLHSALIMSCEERRVSHIRRYKHVMKHTFHEWAKQFLNDLKKAILINNHYNKQMVKFGLGSNLRLMYIREDLKKLKSAQCREKLIYSFKKCKKRILLFDFGGTLTDQYYEDNPNYRYDANFAKIINYLSILSLDPQTYVGIISGATTSELEVAFKDCDENIILCSEKGAFWKWSGMKIGEWEKNTELNVDNIRKWKEIAYDVMKIYCDKCDGSYIQKKSTALIWHYFLCDPEYGKMQAVELERYLKRLLDWYHNVTFQSYDHSRLLEILPKDIHKGTAAITILNNIITEMEQTACSINEDDIFMLAVGNDRSDEKMFEAIELAKDDLKAGGNVFTISIGLKPTQSHYYLSKQIDILWLLQTLCNLLPKADGVGVGGALAKQQSHTEMQYMISKLLKQQQFRNHNHDEKSQCTEDGQAGGLSVDVSRSDVVEVDDDGANEEVVTPLIDHLTSPSPAMQNINNK